MVVVTNMATLYEYASKGEAERRCHWRQLTTLCAGLLLQECTHPSLVNVSRRYAPESHHADSRMWVTVTDNQPSVKYPHAPNSHTLHTPPPFLHGNCILQKQRPEVAS